MGLSFLEFIGVGVITSAVVIMVVFLLMVRYATRTGNKRTYKRIPNRKYALQTQPTYNLPQLSPASLDNSGYGSQKSYHPSVLYHGTSKRNAFDIFHTGTWLIGNSKPPAVWMADTIGIAKIYSGFDSDGAIVVVHVDSDLKIESRGGGVFIYQIPKALPNREYYRIEGLLPVGILDTNGNKIR